MMRPNNLFRRDFSPKSMSGRGFTLVEMLMVMAIIALLSLSIPAIQSSLTAGTFNSNASQVNDELKAAYAAAVSRDTYVWVGLVQMPNNGGVGMVVTYSPSGNPNDVLATPPSYLYKPTILKNLTLATTAIATSTISNADRVTDAKSVAQVFSAANNLTVQNTAGDPVAPVIAASFGGNSQKVGPYNSQAVPTAVMEITPSGQVSISSGKIPWLEIGLQPSIPSSKQAAVLQVNSLNGRVVEFLP